MTTTDLGATIHLVKTQGLALTSVRSTQSIIPLADYQMIWLRGGTGVFEVDFQQYLYQGEELLFLAPGQYFRVLEGELDISRIVLAKFIQKRNLRENLFTRVLFSHVIAVGSIQITHKLSKLLCVILEDRNRDQISSQEQLPSKIKDLLKYSVNTWLRQKPFDKQMSDSEIDIIFDLKHLINQHFRQRPELNYYNEVLNVPQYKLSQVTKSNLDKTPGELEKHHVLLEAERNLVFSSKSAKEITYYLGFNDPPYFNRFFKTNTGLTTLQFRDHYLNHRSEVFINDLMELIDSNYKKEKSVAFYADMLSLAPQSLSAKTNRAIGKNVSDIITSKVAAEAKKMLVKTEMKVSDIAFCLGFKEASHFSHFFKNSTDYYPTEYRELQL